MKQIWLIIEWQLPDGTGRVVKTMEGGYYQAVEEAKKLSIATGSPVSVLESVK